MDGKNELNHLIICREYPPASGGGIGTYASAISHLLAENGETVHVIAQLCPGAEKTIEKQFGGRLIIHRIVYEFRTSFFGLREKKSIDDKARQLLQSNWPPESFAWQATILAERLIHEEKIDIIEAQEFEAPLCYLQDRRINNKLQEKLPPLVVHLHSPTELIGRYNNWQTGHPDYTTAKNKESFSILAADALLCPSRYMSDQILQQFNLPKNNITVIPYPVTGPLHLKRSKEIWANGTICYVGRLEKRKGAIEWIDAAVKIAEKVPDVEFSFVGENVLGTDTMCGEEFVQKRIPKRLKKRFHFAGRQKREAVKGFLENARIGVIPSRWDNFPYACMEMMASGLPVIVSPEGGMKEMVTDSHNGWTSKKADTDELAKTLEKALKTSPDRLSKMGENASNDIRLLCDPQTIYKQHMAVKQRIVAEGAGQSLKQPDLSEIEKNAPYDPKRTVYNDRITIRKIISKLRYGLLY